MDVRKRPQVTPKVMLYALVDALGMLVLASGLMWLVRGQALFVAGFPGSSGAAVGAVIAGIALIVWAVVRILGELTREPAAGTDRR